MRIGKCPVCSQTKILKKHYLTLFKFFNHCKKPQVIYICLDCHKNFNIKEFAMSYGFCPSCYRLQMLEKHHIYPKRFFKAGKGAPILFLCKGCHANIETFLGYKKKTKPEYLRLTKIFLNRQPVRNCFY